jgi:hypothetical protein
MRTPPTVPSSFGIELYEKVKYVSSRYPLRFIGRRRCSFHVAGPSASTPSA